jgi:chemotaxis signal transduction protein
MITALEFSLNEQKFLINAINVDSIVKYTTDITLTKLPHYGDTSTIGVYKYHDKIYHTLNSYQ